MTFEEFYKKLFGSDDAGILVRVPEDYVREDLGYDEQSVTTLVQRVEDIFDVKIEDENPIAHTLGWLYGQVIGER